ncbi:outer membrane protein assembly factor BamB family protein [Haladaptatus sp. NG-SE-30]
MLSLGGGPQTPALFVGSTDPDDVSTDAHALHALSLQKGHEQWRVDLSNPIQTAPRYTGTEAAPRLIFATGQESLHGTAFEIHAVTPDTGDRAWQFDIDDRRFLFPIVTTEKTVFVGQRDDQLAESGEHVYALDATTGDERWRTETGDISHHGNTHRRDTLLIKTSRRVSAFDSTNGDERWQATAESVGYDNRAERVFVESDNSVRALKLADGSELWRRDFDVGISKLTTPRAAMDETVFVGDFDGRLHALSPLDGTTRWTLSVDSDQFYPSVERTSEQLYVAGAGVHAVDPVSGERQWSFTPNVEGYVDVGASRTIFASTDRRLWALNPETGEERWAFAPGGEFAGVATAGSVAFVGVNGTVYALDGSKSA